ncbi:MAG: ECF transporter S component [Deltaproteobacteria bacterium]|nr:ECF transporter S component [Candidatus Zymogenaceae bacterium]
MVENKSLRLTRQIAGTALMLALTAALQISGRYLTPFLGPANIFVVGTLVNACLLIAVDYAGIRGAAVIAFAVPFTALLAGAPIPLPFLPFIGAGNFLLVLMSYLFKRKTIGIFVGAVAKFLFLFGAVAAFLRLTQLPAALSAVLYFSFSWPQLVTALLGGVVYFATRRVLRFEPALPGRAGR